MIGPVLALLSGFSFTFTTILIRKGSHRSGESFSPLAISLFLGTVFFGLAILITGEAIQLASLPLLGVSYLIGAGILHFLLGRSLAYIGLRLIGTNRAVPIQASSVFIGPVLAVLFLDEPVTTCLALALLLVTAGIVSISAPDKPGLVTLNLPRGPLTKGIAASLGAAICWGISPLLVKVGLQQVNSPLLATFISYIAATILIALTLCIKKTLLKYAD